MKDWFKRLFGISYEVADFDDLLIDIANREDIDHDEAKKIMGFPLEQELPVDSFPYATITGDEIQRKLILHWYYMGKRQAYHDSFELITKFRDHLCK